MTVSFLAYGASGTESVAAAAPGDDATPVDIAPYAHTAQGELVYNFATPTGDFECFIAPSQTSCQGQSVAPATAANCADQAPGFTVDMTITNWHSQTPGPDTVRSRCTDPGRPFAPNTQSTTALPHGSKISAYRFTCVTQTDGMTCRSNDSGGHGFRISKESNSSF
ncbi:hypothetical protein ACQPW1_18995 [Nocardia sp. CA-128927]|uniref:hypothetical protein n=1 Tax=Nocardia sp. CA-128927 TaxID=3239975 RepID=UPI003D98384F